MQTQPDAKPGPLNGITVIDLTRVLAGPYCTMVMGELGARVIKIEEPGKGDDSRAYGPFIQGRPCYFGSVNRNKESIALDLKDPHDRAIFEQLLEHADVVAENFRAGVMDKLGYSWETLHQRFPKLIYVAVSGYGHAGPSADQPGYDMVMQGVSGMMSITGEPGGGPCRVGISIADAGTGLFAAIAVNAALLHRERTGETTKIDMAMFDCMLMLLETPITRYLMTGEIAQRMGSLHPAIMPFEAFATADGFITVACGNDKTFRVLCDALGRPELALDPMFATNSDRVANRSLLHNAIEAHLLREPTSHWCAHFERHGVPAAPINTIEQALQHPQVAARNMLVEAQDPVLGAVRLVGSPFKMSAFADPTQRRVAPDLDQDRAAVLREFAIRDTRIS